MAHDDATMLFHQITELQSLTKQAAQRKDRNRVSVTGSLGYLCPSMSSVCELRTCRGVDMQRCLSPQFQYRDPMDKRHARDVSLLQTRHDCV